MRSKSSFGDVKLDVNPGANPSVAVAEPESPFRILLLGDFGGRASQSAAPATRWKPVSIDRDNRDELQSFVESVVAPHLAAAADPELPRFQAQVDAESSRRMRAILNYPAFQALEAAWRALFWLVREIETDSQMKVYVLDVSKPELEADLGSGDLRESQAWRIFVKETIETSGGEPWAVAAGNYAFAKTASDT